MSFQTLGLNPALEQRLTDLGYTQATPVQRQAIPPVLAGENLMAAAQTGTGKTAAFCLPVLQNLHASNKKVKANHIRALVLTPTRELAAQVMENAQTYSQAFAADKKLTADVVYGGVKINPQMQRLRQGVDMLVATPGRLLDLHQQNALKFEQVEVLILDEADRLLDMGFIHDLKRIIALLPKQRQNLMFSATFADEIRQLGTTLMQNPVMIDVSPPNRTTRTVKQKLIAVDKKRKPALLTHLIKTHQWHQVLVFSRTKHGANKLVRILDAAKIKALAIHGNKSQSARLNALKQFKQGDIQVLVATDIAARGLDIHELPMVINIDLPNVAEDYVHRIGRTGRAEHTGEAISLVSADEFDNLTDIEQLTQQAIERDYESGYEPVHDLPESKPIRPLKQKRPKKAKPSARASSFGSKPKNHFHSAEKAPIKKPNNRSGNNKPHLNKNKPAHKKTTGPKR